MTFQQELQSWWSLSGPPPARPPKIGSKAPDTPRLGLRPNQPTIIAFLRHCGCPFAEKCYLNLREVAKEYKDIDFIAVSHSDQQSTDYWLRSLPQAGSESSNLRVVVDDKVEIYCAWGLGPSNWSHVLSPWSLYTAYQMGKNQGIWNRPTQSGSRWQTSGFYSVDAKGIVRLGGPAQRADEMPDFKEAIQSVRGDSKL